MTRYIYRGPYGSLEINDKGTKKTVAIGGPVDLDDDEMVNDQIRRGIHLFEVVQPEPSVDAADASREADAAEEEQQG